MTLVTEAFLQPRPNGISWKDDSKIGAAMGLKVGSERVLGHEELREASRDKSTYRIKTSLSSCCVDTRCTGASVRAV